VRELLAVQAQDLPAARLALRARGRGFAASDVDAALAAGELVIAWLMRGTLHLVAREDHGWLLGLTAPPRSAANRRRLVQEGVPPADAERAVELIVAALADGPLTRHELAQRLDAAGIRTAGQATPHLLMLAALRGRVVRAGTAFVACEPPGPPPGDALARLARRWLSAHGPADARDLAAWAGLPLRDARAGLDAIGPELRDVGDGLLDLADAPRSRARLPPALLGAFDPYLLGWRDRGFAVDPGSARRVHPGGGILRSVALEDGRAVATWRRARGGGIELEPFAPLAPDIAAALAAEAADVARFERG
jgi:winged helix DNA-binding protein